MVCIFLHAFIIALVSGRTLMLGVVEKIAVKGLRMIEYQLYA